MIRFSVSVNPEIPKCSINLITCDTIALTSDIAKKKRYQQNVDIVFLCHCLNVLALSLFKYEEL